MDKPTADLSMRRKLFVFKIAIFLISLLLVALIWRVGTAYYAIHTAVIKMNEVESETIQLAERSTPSNKMIDKTIIEKDRVDPEAEVGADSEIAASKIGEDA